MYYCVNCSILWFLLLLELIIKSSLLDRGAMVLSATVADAQHSFVPQIVLLPQIITWSIPRFHIIHHLIWCYFIPHLLLVRSSITLLRFMFLHSRALMFLLFLQDLVYHTKLSTRHLILFSNQFCFVQDQTLSLESFLYVLTLFQRTSVSEL